MKNKEYNRKLETRLFHIQINLKLEIVINFSTCFINQFYNKFLNYNQKNFNFFLKNIEKFSNFTRTKQISLTYTPITGRNYVKLIIGKF